MGRIAFDIGILPRAPVRELTEIAVRAEALGYSGIWVADSQSIFRDVYPVLTAMALATKKIMLATGVTNPLTRHPAVTASSIATLDEISEGRALLGIGTGESAVRTVGLPAARLVQMEAYVLTVRRLLAGKEVEYEGKTLKLTWTKRKIPIHVAASGPKSLQLAGRVGDGVLFQVGAREEMMEYALDNIRKGTSQAGRKLSEIELCMRLATSIDRNRDQARAEIRPYAAAACVTTFRSVPPDRVPESLREDYARLRQQYDYYKHVSRESSHQELVTDKILDAVAIAGTPQEAIPLFQRIVDKGVDRIVMPVTGSEPLKMLELMAREVLPHVVSG